jgi:hypothetical protein
MYIYIRTQETPGAGASEDTRGNQEGHYGGHTGDPRDTSGTGGRSGGDTKRTGWNNRGIGADRKSQATRPEGSNARYGYGYRTPPPPPGPYDTMSLYSVQ